MEAPDSSAHDDDKLHCANELRQHLHAAKALRRMANDAPEAARKRLILREWQAARLSRTYPDLLTSERFGKAAHFFLSDLYGPKDFSSRDEEVERIMPLMLSILPLSALQTLSLAIEVDALSEELDAVMIAELEKAGGYKVPPSQTPWQEIFRQETDQLAQGMVLKGATKFRRVAKLHPVPRDNH